MRSCRSSALPDEAEVDVAVEQHLLHRGAVAAEERAAAGGILPGEARHVARQKALRRHGGGAERQLERAVDRDVEQQSAASAEDVLRVAVDALALKRERQPPLGLAVEELEMQQLLQRADVVAHRGLGKVELFRGGGEAAGVHDGGKDLKLTEIQTFHRTASFCGFLNVIVESAAWFVKCFHGKFGVFHRKKR